MNPALIVAAVLFLSQNQGKLPFGPSSAPLVGKSVIPAGKSVIPAARSVIPAARSIIPAIKDPGYFDTFRMEMLLDRLHNMTNTLEKVNHLNQSRNIPLNKNNSIDRVQESLEAVKGLMYANKSTKHIDNLSNTLSNVKQLGDMQGLMTNMAPILSMLSNKNDK